MFQIRILVVILLANNAICQDGFNERDILRYSHMPANDGQYGTINYNIMQRSPTSQAVSSMNMQFVDDLDSTDDYNRADKKRTRKVFRIKNPFQQQEDTNQQQDGNIDPPDNGTGASNQYATMQYSLPPEEFLQQMRAENQYYQQQHSTPSPNLGYTATPQPQYQYSTISPLYENTNQQGSQVPQLDPKSHTQYLTSNFQYSPNTYNLDSAQSTPPPIAQYVSTAPPNNQLVGTAANTYVSSSSPIYISSPPNLQYVSSPLSAIQTGSPDYIGSRVTSTIGSNSFNYDSNDQNKKMQIDHYDNSAHGIRFPVNLQRQYQNDYGASTPSPTTLSYPDSRDPWNSNPGVNAMPKSIQDVAYTQYQGYAFNQQENRADSNVENVNTETHRVDDVPSANNVFYNIMHPDSPTINNARNRVRDVEHETGQPNYYTHGEYGWKVTGNKKPQMNDVYSSGSYQRFQTQPESNAAVSQMSFHIDTSKPFYDQVAKNNQDNVDAQEFAKAAARAHENMKQQQNFYNSYENNNYSNNNQAPPVNPYFNNLDKQKNKYQESSGYYNSQPDLITASPYFFNSRENNIENKPKQPFDHAKALKNIVPNDVSNVLPNSEQQKGVIDTRYTQNYEKEQADQSRQYYKTLTDAYYKDKNSIYGFNIKSKPEDYIGADSSNLYYNRQQPAQDSNYNQGNYGITRNNYMAQASGSLSDNIQSSGIIQQQALQRQQTSLPTDINSILKLNDVPYHLTQGLSPESLKFQNSNFDRSNIPSPLPLRLNQDVGNHQLDVTANLLSKLMLNKQPGLDVQRPDLDSQGMLSTINGFKVANPFNVDLKLVAEMLKGKSGVEDSHLMPMRDHQYSKPPPLKLDLSQLQLLFKNDNPNNVGPINDMGVLGNPFLEIYSAGRYPYQGVKYSRSQEEEESIVPIADASSNHPIGAVIEQDDPNSEREDDATSDITGTGSISVNHEENRPKKQFIPGFRAMSDRHRHPNALLGRHPYQRKYPKSEVEEPYPLLKPPPPHGIRGRGSHMKMERHGRRRRVNKPKVFRIMKAEPLFEAETEDENVDSVPVVLRPPAPVVEEKSDIVVNDKNL